MLYFYKFWLFLKPLDFFTWDPREPGSPGKVPVPAAPCRSKQNSIKVLTISQFPIEQGTGSSREPQPSYIAQ